MRSTQLGMLLVLASLLGCPEPQLVGEPPAGGTQAWLQKITSCDELHDEVVTAWTETLVQARYGYGYDFAEDDAAPTGDGGPSDWSETNVQEEGVDEPDLVETDGEFIYIVQRGELTILDSWPADQTAIVASLPLPSNPNTMFLNGDRILTFGWAYDVFPPDEDWRSVGAARMTLIDVSDRAAPTVLRTIDLDGWMVDARRIDDDVYVVLDTWLGMPWELYDLIWDENLELPEPDGDADEDEQAELRDEARAILRPLVEAFAASVEAQDLLPRQRDSADDSIQPLLECHDIYKPREVGEVSMLSVVHFDMSTGADGGDVSATGLLSDGWTVYASQENLYIARSSWWWWWGWSELELTTNIHKFHLAGGDTSYEASGEVPGWLLNSFSLGEHDGHLRVATTDNDWWWGTEQGDEPANNVFVLQQTGGALETVGEVRGIAPGERIYASRFLGDRGFLVTFFQIDPLFTLDLSDPTNPRVIGELETPGFSAYLHPFEEDHLLAAGMDGTAEGQITGFSLSLFDVSDFTAPALTDRITVGSDWGWSEVLWDHHAFTFHRDVLSVPAYWWDAEGGFSGLVVIACATDGLTLLGTVDHADLVPASECLWDWEDACETDYWYAQVRRSVVIEDWLYSISDYGLKVTALEDPTTEVARVLFWPAGG